MANIMKLELTDGMERMLRELDSMGENVQTIVEKTIIGAAQQIQIDTVKALDKANLPAGGRYSKGDTRRSVVSDLQVHWEGLTAWIPIGFDFEKPGAGGYLITGTPRMKPDAALSKMYKQKAYMKKIQDDMENVILDLLVKAGGQK